MSKVDVRRRRMENHASGEYSASVIGDTFGGHSARLSASVPRRMPQTARSILSTEDSVPHRMEFGNKTGANSLKKFEDMNSKMNFVNYTNGLLRERISSGIQKASLTRENLMILEETIQSNRPAEQLRRKKEFIQKEMERSRQNAGSAEAKALLLRKINEREEKKMAEKQIRADSVLDDLRKERFRAVAHMAQKRLQSITPDLPNTEDGLSNRLDWYLRFCGEKEKNEDHKEDNNDDDEHEDGDNENDRRPNVHKHFSARNGLVSRSSVV